MKTKLFFSALLLSLLFSCKKESDPTHDEPSLKQYATLEITVSLCHFNSDPFCDSLVAIPGARIYLFEKEFYRDEHIGVLDEGTTGSSGKVIWNALELPEYWLTVQLPQPDGRVEKEYVKTPLRTTTYLPMIFKAQ